MPINISFLFAIVQGANDKIAVFCCVKHRGGVGKILTKIVRQRTDMVGPMSLHCAHTTSRVAVVAISFPTDLEKYMAARLFQALHVGPVKIDPG